MSVTVSDGDPAVITKISLNVITPPVGAPIPERLTQQAAAAAWKAEIAKAASAGRFSGVWLWAKSGKVITSGAIGYADREAGIDNTQCSKKPGTINLTSYRDKTCRRHELILMIGDSDQPYARANSWISLISC